MPPEVNVLAPDYDRIHRMIAKAIRKSERDRPASGPTDATPDADPASPGPSSPTAPVDNPREANSTDDLESAC